MNNIQKILKQIFPEARKVFLLFLPLFMSQLTYAASTFIGTLMIAHLGQNALAALALVSSTYTSLCVFFYGIFVSISILVSQNFGAKNIKGIHLAVSQGFILAIICTIPFMIIMWSVPTIFRWTGQDPIVIELATPYLHTLSYSILPWLFLVVMEQFLIGLSLTRLVFWISVLQVPFEILINYAFIFGKFGFPNSGIAGLGYGFTMVFVLSVVIIGVFISNSRVTMQYKIFNNFGKLNKASLKDLFKTGIPIGCTNVIENLFFLVVVLLLGKFGTDALAGQQIIRQYLELVVTMGLAMTQAVTVLVGQAVGNKNHYEVKLSTYVSMALVANLMLIIAIIYIVFPHAIISLDVDVTLSENSNLVNYTKKILVIAGIFQIFDSIRLISIGTLRGLKDTKLPMYITTLAFWIIGLPCAYVFGFILDFQGVGVWFGILVGMIIGTSILLLRLRKILNNLNFSLLQEEPT